MYIWSISWLWFKLEFGIDLRFSREIVIALLPAITVSYLSKLKRLNIFLSWFTIDIILNYRPDNIYIRNTEGEVTGKRVYPSYCIEERNY